MNSADVVLAQFPMAGTGGRKLRPVLVLTGPLGSGWHVDFEPGDPNVHGGGPHYVIDPTDGTIISKKYFQ